MVNAQQYLNAFHEEWIDRLQSHSDEIVTKFDVATLWTTYMLGKGGMIKGVCNRLCNGDANFSYIQNR